MTKLTRTQAKALEFIRSASETNGVSPTLRELCAFMGYKAVGSAQDIVTALRRKGFLIETDRQAARTLILTPQARLGAVDEDRNQDTSLEIPLLGKVPAGNPALAVEERIGSLRVAFSLVGISNRNTAYQRTLFGLQATGESMIGAGILDGDFLVVRITNELKKGSIVVARVDGDVTVKRLMYDDKTGWYLKPENPQFSNIYATSENYELIGEVIALQRAMF